MKLHSLLFILPAAALLLAHDPLDITTRERIVVEGIPDPGDVVRISEGAVFTVPPDKLLVLTAFGPTIVGPTCQLKINGIVELGGITRLLDAPKWLVAQPGDVVEVDDNQPGNTFGRAYGYLADL